MSQHTFWRYGLLGMPLAFLGLPIYVHLPKFYSDTLGISLVSLGALMLATRLWDAVQDPIIGIWSDHAVRKGVRRYRIMLWACPFLFVSFWGLFHIPDGLTSTAAMLGWVSGMLLVVYTAYSIITINYYAMGAEISEGYHQRNTLATWREAMALLGALLAASAPVFAGGEGILPWMLIPLMVAAMVALPNRATLMAPLSATHNRYRELWHNRSLRWMVAILLFNATASAIPGTLLLFYVEDILQATPYSGAFLVVYFISGAACAPLFNLLAKRTRKRTALLVSMLVAIGGFIWAYNLQAGDVLPFFIICMLSGAALGGDLVLIPSILADISRNEAPDQAGAIFSIWGFITKLTLALAAGIGLPLLEILGYQPQQPDSSGGHGALIFCYAVLPCLLKLMAFALCYISPLDRTMPDEAKQVNE